MRGTHLTWAFSVSENNTAIIVGCMPAFARFVKLVSTEISSRWSRSKLMDNNNNEGSYGKWEQPGPLPQFNPTIGSSGRKPRQYYELSDTALLKTQVSVSGDGHQAPQDREYPPESGIVRTLDIHQQASRLGGRSPSVEHLA